MLKILFDCTVNEAFSEQYYWFGVYDKQSRKQIMPELPFEYKIGNILYGTSNGFMFNLAEGEYFVLFQSKISGRSGPSVKMGRKWMLRAVSSKIKFLRRLKIN